MASKFTLPDSRTLSYSLDATPENAPVVVLSNPLNAPLACWDHVVPVLNKNGFRTLRYDQPGHGASSSPTPLESTTFEMMADDVHALLQNLGLQKVHGWIGDSMGAAASIYFVTKYPGVVSKLAICDTTSCSPVNAGGLDIFAPRIASARSEGSLDNLVPGTLERWLGSDWLEKNPEEARRMRALMLTTTIDGFEACCHALKSKSFDLRPLFGKIGAAVDQAICVVGEKDANLPETMADMRKEIEAGFKAAGKDKEVELAVIKGSGHVPFIDGFEQFCNVITLFLKG